MVPSRTHPSALPVRPQQRNIRCKHPTHQISPQDTPGAAVENIPPPWDGVGVSGIRVANAPRYPSCQTLLATACCSQCATKQQAASIQCHACARCCSSLVICTPRHVCMSLFFHPIPDILSILVHPFPHIPRSSALGFSQLKLMSRSASRLKLVKFMPQCCVFLDQGGGAIPWNRGRKDAVHNEQHISSF